VKDVSKPRTLSLTVFDGGSPLTFTYEAMLAYSGPGSPGGVAHAFKVLERALPLLDPTGPAERRELEIVTAFGGPGARDGFELVTRAVTGERYLVDQDLARPERGPALERFVFQLRYRQNEVTVYAREGYVPEELIELTRRPERTDAEEARLTQLKLEMAALVINAPAADVYATD
jgi:hypothetical protein